mmetsp:Transcript_42068/g.64480  ORF Transcript_42068/g.64480 Transcript_42068/m.64480 type:complete len:184 (+) Transcript_42068:2000-2551(+)
MFESSLGEPTEEQLEQEGEGDNLRCSFRKQVRKMMTLFSNSMSSVSSEHPTAVQRMRSLRYKKMMQDKETIFLGRREYKTPDEVPFLEYLASRMETAFALPEEHIVAQNDTGRDVFFISKGDCAVDIRDQRNRHSRECYLLGEGAHFGEIGMIYGCPRTATIMSRNFTTLAKISADNCRAVIN